MTRPSLDVSRAVGAAGWARLPAALRRRFAPGHGPVTYRGSLDVERSRLGWLFAVAASLLGRPLPVRAGRDVPAEVRVREDGQGGVVWERWLLEPGRAATCIRSTKLHDDGGGRTVLERTSGGVLGLGVGMVLDVFEDAGGLVFQSRGYFLTFGARHRHRLPLPGLLTPGRCRVEHRPEESGDPSRFRFTLLMDHPVWGRTFRQTGLFTDPTHMTTKELPA